MTTIPFSLSLFNEGRRLVHPDGSIEMYREKINSDYESGYEITLDDGWKIFFPEKDLDVLSEIGYRLLPPDKPGFEEWFKSKWPGEFKWDKNRIMFNWNDLQAAYNAGKKE